MKTALLGTALASAALLAPALAPAQECTPAQQTIGWSQPNKVPITNENAVRWPTDASMRVAYGGSWCPSADEIELLDENDQPIPAQVRIRTPYTLVQNAPTPLTMIEVDPVGTFAERGDYRLVVRPPDPVLVANREYTVEFRTRGSESDPFPDFEGITSVGLDGPPCGETGSFEGASNDNPACPLPNRLRLLITFQPLDRADTAYVIYRTSTTGTDENGDPVPDLVDETPIPLQYENGARDIFGAGIPERPIRLTVPYYPLPRTDCFAVRALDEFGRERGDLDHEACVDLPRIDPLPPECDPNLFPPFPEPSPFEATPPMPGQMCPNVGLAGADPDAPIPPIGEEENDMGPTGDGGPIGDGGPLGDGGVVGDGGSIGGDDDDDGGGGGAGGCLVHVASGNDLPAWPLALFALLGLRRRRRH